MKLGQKRDEDQTLAAKVHSNSVPTNIEGNWKQDIREDNYYADQKAKMDGDRQRSNIGSKRASLWRHWDFSHSLRRNQSGMRRGHHHHHPHRHDEKHYHHHILQNHTIIIIFIIILIVSTTVVIILSPSSHS